MRQLVRWSESSLRVTTPRPCQGEPSRCMTLFLLSLVLEVAAVDQFEARQIGHVVEPSASGDNGGSRLGPDVAVGEKLKLGWSELLDGPHAWDRREPVPQPLPLRLDLYRKAASKHLAPEFGHRAHQHDLAGAEQSHPVAHALDAIEQMRGEQNADIMSLEIAN